MLFYIVIFAIVILFAQIADEGQKPYAGLLAIVVLLSVVLGLRDYGVGTDTLIYPEDYFDQARLLSFDAIGDLVSEFDLGYLFLAYVANLFGEDSRLMLFVTEFFIITVTTIGIYRLKNMLGFRYVAFFAIYCLLFLNNSMNYMRQNCAVSLLLLGYSYMLEGNWKKYGVLQFAAYFFHSSSVLFLIIPFFLLLYRHASAKVRNITLACFFVGIVIAVIGFYQYLQILSDLGAVSETYGERYGEAGEYSGGNLYGVAYLAYIALIYYLLFYSYKNEVLPEEDLYIAICLHTSSVLFFYTSTYVVFLNRLAIYFDYIVVVYLAMMLSSRQIPLHFRLALLLVQFYLWVRICVLAGNSETIPYTSDLLGIS